MKAEQTESGGIFQRSSQKLNLKKDTTMSVKNRKELFVMLLSNLRQAAEGSSKLYTEMAQLAEDPRVREILEARAFIANQMHGTFDEVFKDIGERPVKSSSRIHDVFIEDFRRELGEIQSPEAKGLFLLTKALQFTHLRVGEVVALIAAADMTGHHGVGLLLESCLGETLAFIDRTRRVIRNIAEAKIAAKVAA